MPSQVPDKTVRGNPRKRVLEACIFCRRRKIRCNAARPQCSNCTRYKRQCIYDKKNEETVVEGATTSESTSDIPPVEHVEREVNSAEPPANTTQTPYRHSNDLSISRILVSDGQSSYHGQTSALYELQEARQPAKGQRFPASWVKKALIAEAAIQRQMETINFQEGSLDFDGVEPELGKHLLELHFNRQHHSFLISYRPAFMRDMACEGPYFSKLLLNAIYYGSAKFSPRLEVRKDASDVRTAGWKYRQRVRELLGSELERSSITTIQALLIMANSLFALGNERSAAWLYSGLAFRMITDLGMHSEASTMRAQTLNDEDVEIRRRVFWGAFVVDKIQSLYHGRMPTLQTDDASVPVEFLDLYEEHEQWQPFAYNEASVARSYGQAYSVSTFTALCKLSVVMNSVLSQLYAERVMQSNATTLSRILGDLQKQLDQWRNDLPNHLRLESLSDARNRCIPHVLSLKCMFEVNLILVHRPFVSDGHLFNHARSLSVSSLLTCVTAASQITRILRLYHQAFSIQRAPYLISYATYVAATIHVRVAAQRAAGSDAHKQLSQCIEVLRLNEGTNWAAKRAKTIVEGLMRKFKVRIEDVAIDLDEREQNEQREQVSQSNSDQATGFSPNFNIDAVIQSFAENQERFDSSNLQHRDDATLRGAHDQMHFGPENSGANNWETLNSAYYQNSAISAISSDGVTQEWQFSAYPTLDSLFGFEGAVTDGFFQQPYT